MEYIPLNSIPHYNECESLVRALGFLLVDLKIIPQKTTVKINVVIANADAQKTVSLEDCEKVHRVLLPRLQALLKTDQTFMELSSPGTDRNIKNAAEFLFFLGRDVRVWEKNEARWICGCIKNADENFITLQSKEGEKKIGLKNIAKAKFN